jgi:Uma2 family endonuclease
MSETELASEYIENQIVQKPMPKGRHSLLQYEICHAVNQCSRAEKIAYAFPELRCSFADR